MWVLPGDGDGDDGDHGDDGDDGDDGMMVTLTLMIIFDDDNLPDPV